MKDLTGKKSIRNATTFDAGDFSGQEYIKSDDGVGFSALLVTVDGAHPKKRMLDTTRNYYVIEGEGTFTIDDEVHRTQVGDLFTVMPGHTYSYSGKMKLFEFNVSSDNSFRDEILG